MTDCYDNEDQDVPYRTRHPRKSRAETFPSKLNDDLRYRICFRIALSYTTRQIMGWLLKAHNISVTYQGLRKYWHTKRWVRVTENIKARITDRPEIREMIQGMLKDWLEGERKVFENYARELLGDLRKDQPNNDPNKAAPYQIVGLRLVEKFNETLRNVEKVAWRLSMQRRLNSTYP